MRPCTFNCLTPFRQATAGDHADMLLPPPLFECFAAQNPQANSFAGNCRVKQVMRPYIEAVL